MASEADTVIMLSSELIAEVMQVYFNKVMFKKKVEIVDLQPTEKGYAFSLSFAVEQKQTLSKDVYFPSTMPTVEELNGRDGKGRFLPKKATV